MWTFGHTPCAWDANHSRQLAVALAQRHKGEIINADAMQLYAGLPIITNKITEEERQGVSHHLLGCIDVLESTWVVGTFVKRTLKIIDEIRSRGKLPILVGGTHYYTQSCLFKDRLADEVLEEEGEREFIADTKEKWPILQEPTPALLEELKRVDPVMASRWHPNDRRKIQRSLEIYLQTGRKASDVYTEQRERNGGESRTVEGKSTSILDGPAMRFPTLLFWIHAENGVLRDRLDRRVDQMVEHGLLDEVRALDIVLASEVAQGRAVDETRGIWVSIGYKEFKSFMQALESNQASEGKLQRLKAEAIERTKIATRQYAKRQIRWIRIKLVNALASADASDSLYLLDGSDTTRFDTDVIEPALGLAQQFLVSSPMPAPSSISVAAADLLTPTRDYDLSAKPEKWTNQYCELCGVTCVTEEQWSMHVKSKAHRKLLSKSKKGSHLNSAKHEQGADHPT